MEGRNSVLDSLSAHPNASHAAAALEALEHLDETIHQKARLGIMSALLALAEADFKLLKETLSLSDGNLSTHLALLEERGYVTVRKEFVRRKPRTTYTPTELGRSAFQQYLLALEKIIRAAEAPSQTESQSDRADTAPPPRGENAPGIAG